MDKFCYFFLTSLLLALESITSYKIVVSISTVGRTCKNNNENEYFCNEQTKLYIISVIKV